MNFGPAVEQREDGLDKRWNAEPQEDPIPFLSPANQAAVYEHLQMLGDLRLSLSEHLGKLADGQLHLLKQIENPDADRIGKGMKQEGVAIHESLYADIGILNQQNLYRSYSKKPDVPGEICCKAPN